MKKLKQTTFFLLIHLKGSRTLDQSFYNEIQEKTLLNEFFVVAFIFPVLSLKELKIFVPEAVIMGNAATLSCQYDLEDVSIA